VFDDQQSAPQSAATFYQAKPTNDNKAYYILTRQGPNGTLPMEL
jgi:hypothetical protein